jgi:hypothetical protein
MRPRKWRVRCSRGTASARPSGRSSGARGTRSGGMRRASRPPIPLPSGRLCTKPVRSESGKRRWRPAAPRGRCGSNCRHTTMWCAWPGILPPRDGGSARTAGTSSPGRTAKTTLRAWPGSSPVTGALMRVRPSGSGGLIYIHPGVTVARLLLAALLDPGRLRVLRPALRLWPMVRQGFTRATRLPCPPRNGRRRAARSRRGPVRPAPARAAGCRAGNPPGPTGRTGPSPGPGAPRPA